MFCGALLLALFSCKENDLQDKIVLPNLNRAFALNLNGNVREISEKSWEVNDSNTRPETIFREIPMHEKRWELDTTNLQIVFKDWKLGRRLQMIIYRYDKSGLLKHWHIIDQMERQSKTVENEYNSKGQIVESQMFNISNKLIEQTYFEYDSLGREFSRLRKVYRHQGNQRRSLDQYETINNYQDTTNSTSDKEVITLKNGLKESEQSYSKGRLHRSRQYYANGQIKSITTFDSLAQIVAYEYDSLGKFMAKQVEIQGSNGQIKRILIFDSHNILSYWEKASFDEMGNLIEQHQAFGKVGNEGQTEIAADSLSPEIFEFQFEYDSLNNWTQKLSYENEKLIKVEIREIEYFQP